MRSFLSGYPLRVFVTVGAQMPFDRMVGAVDDWAANRRNCVIFAQIGSRTRTPRHIEWTDLLEPPQFKQRIEWCDVLVAHAGMGSILTALQYGKPIVVMPRRGDLRETRNDHQIATARRFKAMGQVEVAMDELEMLDLLDRLQSLAARPQISDQASEQLIETIKSFIHQ